MGVWGSLIQGALGVDSGIQQGKQDRKQADANTAAANDAATESLRRGALEAGQVRSEGSQLQAKQNVAYANSGVDATVGTAATVQAATKSKAELDALTVENNAAREAWGYKAHGIAFQTQAALNTSRRNREIAGTVIGSAGQTASGLAKDGWI